MKYIILHGTGATPKSNWFGWLRNELTKRGHEVWLPQLPKADKPNQKRYTLFLLGDETPFKIDDQTILIGHSSGAVQILNLLQALQEDVVIKGAILVSAFKDDLGWESLSELFDGEFDFDKIRKHCQRFIFLHSDNDPYVPLEQAYFLAKKTGGEIQVMKSQGHFNTEHSSAYVKFPDLLRIVNEMAES